MKKLRTLVSEYLKLCKKRKLSRAYVAEQTRVLEGMVSWIAKDDIKEVQTYEIYDFIEMENRAAFTKIKRINIIKGFWNWVCEQYAIKNPTARIIPPAIPDRQDIVVHNVTTELIEDLCSECDPNTGAYHAIKTVWACGFRVEQLLHLALSDVDEHKMLVLGAPIPDHHTLEQIHLLLAYMVRASKLSSFQLRRVWTDELSSAVKAVGCEPVRFLDIRNACIDRWIREHYSPKSIMSWAGIKTTKTLWRHYEAADLEHYVPGPLYKDYETTL
ncbi:MAG TPA: hypothetical protein DCW74_17185 [Alteromonas australica]|uniref:Integrase n=1 Tax=Alteromonas australica TaxID=589873 RepID=A0A350P838_9ALTE|nr:hypothetical protein [Alteromonas australica]|tara:strand:- start:1141 stop:1956 length:816 start_codon:yes stop_codon:yes gene_type:complete